MNVPVNLHWFLVSIFSVATAVQAQSLPHCDLPPIKASAQSRAGAAKGSAKAMEGRQESNSTKEGSMFLQSPPATEATSQFYKSDLDQPGYIQNLSRLWAWRPEVSDAFSALRAQLTSRSTLSNRDLSMLVCATAATIGDSYCALAWGKRLAKETSPKAAASVLAANPDKELTTRDRALSAWAQKVARNPSGTRPGDVEELRAAGLTEREIFEATTFIAFRIAFSTVNDALGAKPDWRLAADAPPEVRGAITYGRPAESAP